MSKRSFLILYSDLLYKWFTIFWTYCILIKITFRNSVLALKAISLKGILPRSTKIRPLGTEPSVQNKTKPSRQLDFQAGNILSLNNRRIGQHCGAKTFKDGGF